MLVKTIYLDSIHREFYLVSFLSSKTHLSPFKTTAAKETTTTPPPPKSGEAKEQEEQEEEEACCRRRIGRRFLREGRRRRPSMRSAGEKGSRGGG